MKLHVVECRDNDLYAFRGRVDVPRCPACGGLVDKWNPQHLGFAVPQGMPFDISSTYDGVTVVSPRFKALVSESALVGLVFLPLAHGFSALLATRRIAFDSATRKTRFERACARCGTHDTVVGATPAFLGSPTDVALNEFAWTDLEFGSGDERHPLLICGEAAGDSLRSARLTGLEPFGEVRGP